MRFLPCWPTPQFRIDIFPIRLKVERERANLAIIQANVDAVTAGDDQADADMPPLEEYAAPPTGTRILCTHLSRNRTD